MADFVERLQQAARLGGSGDSQADIARDLEVKRQICSVLAGYVWDETNPFVKEHHTAVTKLARIIGLRDKIAAMDNLEAKKQ